MTCEVFYTQNSGDDNLYDENVLDDFDEDDYDDYISDDFDEDGDDFDCL